MGTVPVTSTNGSGNDNAETLREKGNAEFRLGRFMKAIDYYTKAIDCCNENTSNGTPWWSYIFFWRQSKTFSLLSRLHGNRAECYLRSNRPTQALTDSLERAKQDSRNFRAHDRVGKSGKELGETDQAIESFVTAFNVLSSNCTQATKQEILSEIVKCKCMHHQIAVPQLYTVGGEMWAEMVLFHVSASDWVSAYKDYLLMRNTPMMVTQVDLDLKPLCNTRFLCENHWAGDFILFLLKMGSKHHTMTTRADDTYLHAGLKVAFASQNMGVFKWLFENKALPRHETHMKDGDGNSILHTACMCFAPQLMKIRVLTYLTQNCVDPHATNHMGRKAIQCIQPSDDFIKAYFFSLSIHYAPFTITSNKEEMGAERICESMYEEGWASISRQDTARGVGRFVGILLQYHTEACHHTVVEKCLWSIVYTASPSDLDNNSIKKVHVSIVKALIERFASRGMWKHMKTVVDVYGDEGLDSGLPNSISIPNLLDCDTINDFEKEHFLRIANRYGAKCPAKYFSQVMLKAALNKSVGLMECLFDIGGSPFYLSTNSDEPQLHAVFNAASFGQALLRGLAFLKKLIALHRSNPTEYHYLYPGRADAQGDTLLHLACKRKYSNAALELVQLLIQEGVQVNTKNKAGLTPVDCIVKHNDRRLVLLIKAGYTTPKTGSINSQGEKEKEKLSEHQNKSSFTTEELAEKRSSQESTEKGSNQQQHSLPGKDTSQIQNVRMLVERLCANNKGSQHQRTIEQIVDTANVEDLPGSLMTIPLPQLKNLIQTLASKGKWHHVQRTIEILGAENLSPTLFQSISIRNFIASDSFQGQEDRKLELYTIFCDHGGNLSPKKGAESMHFAVKYKEVQLALRLVEDGVNTSAVTTDSGGNTPIHTALILALEKGNFGLLEKLMQLYKDDSKRHSDLNPNQGNLDQDTPLHVACKYPFSENAYTAVKLLCHWKVRPNAKNSEGKTPVQYVKDDKRFQLLNGYRLTPHKGMKEETRIQTKAPKKRPASETILEEHMESCKARIREKLCRMAKQKLSDIIKLDDKSGLGASEKSSYQRIDSDVLDFDNLIWEIECLPSFWKELLKMTCVVKSQVIKALNQIGKGEWTRNVHKPVTHNGLQIPLYEAKTSKAARIIWEVGISRDISNQLSNTMYHEVIRVWAVVLDHDKLQRTIAQVVECHKRSESREKIKKMLKGYKHSQFEGCMKQRMPMSYVAARTNNEDDLDFCPLVSDDTKMPHIHKFQTISSAMVDVILQNVHINVDFLFKVTDKERSIIDMKSKGPVLLLGRSGTGKTTCCVYRLWTHFATYWEKIREIGQPNLPMQDEEFESNSKKITDPDTHIHQLFLTKNNVLCTEVHKHFIELCRGQMATRRHAHKASEDLPPRLQDIDDLSYPLFLTSKQYLLMLDASLGPSYFFQREPDGTLSVRIDGWDDGTTLFGISPLNIDPKDDDPNIEKGFPRNTQTKPMDPRKEVTYEVFASEIWPDIATKVAMKYHPSLVWAEIMSFIKGSFEALSNESGHLTKDEYIDVGRKKAPFFVGKREIIYELFEKYSRFIKQRGLFDIVDVIQNIYKRLLDQWRSRPFIIHQIYVDEIQDFTEAELFLLLSIMRNPNGMFLTGDAVQGITKGVSFRFCDLKSLFHHAKVSGLFETQYTITVPGVQKLTHNYRSHNGVLSLTSAILDVMEEFFPESFDKVHMERDVGLFQGPAPVLIQSCRREDLHTLLQGRNSSSSLPIDFGAHQAILVVNEEAKACVPEEMSRRCNVLTIFESKGLEFNDILLFNFFKDSQASKEWRVVASCLGRHAKTFTEDHEVSKSIGVHPLAFEPNKHKILNFELKYLYTALTRARVNVWIFDEDEEKRAPMFQFFKAKNLVRCKSGQNLPDDSTDDSRESEADVGFAEESTPVDWVSQGDTFMVRRLYDDAAKCYRIAGDIQKEKSSMALSRALKAVGLKNNPRAMKKEYITAAEEFIDCDLGPKIDKKAALCLQYAEEYELAGMAYEKCEEFKYASTMYHHAEEFDAETRCLEKAELAARNET